MHSRKLIEELASGTDSALPRLEDNVNTLPDTELDAVAALEFVALDSLSVDKGAVAAADIDDEKFPFFGNNLGMFAGDARVGNHNIAISFAPHGEGAVVHIEIALGIPFHHL